jgi:CubicO group peptidase (beta-lactamase class C family)
VLARVLGDERHPSIQLYASRGGSVAVDVEVTGGRADETTESRRLFPLLSTAKPILAATALKVCRDAGLHHDDPLVAAIPELHGQGRDRIRLRDVLTHQTGYPSMPTRAELVTASWPEAFALAIAAEEPIEPGSVACYQEWRYWYLLGEFISRVTGRPVPDVVRAEVLEPLGLAKEIVLGSDAVDAWAAGRLGDFEPAAGLLLWPQRYDDPQRGWRGGVNTFGSVRAVATFLAALPGGTGYQPDGVFRDLPAVNAPWRTGITDGYFSAVRDWGLGVMLEPASRDRRSLVFSRYAAPGSYGHVARRAVAAFHDPIHRVTGAVLGSGPLNPVGTRYFLRSAGTAIYTELGLAG